MEDHSQFQARDYAQLTAQLELHDVETSAAEVHGIACGLICSGTPASTGLWPRLLGDADEPLPDSLDRNLGSLMETLRQQFLSSGFEIELMIPGDEQTSSERLQGMASWSQGFTMGFFAENEREIHTLPGSAPEILRDMIEIAGADTETDDADDNETERALTEIEEYLRVGAQLVFEEIQDEITSAEKAENHENDDPDQTPRPTLH